MSRVGFQAVTPQNADAAPLGVRYCEIVELEQIRRIFGIWHHDTATTFPAQSVGDDITIDDADQTRNVVMGKVGASSLPTSISATEYISKVPSAQLIDIRRVIRANVLLAHILLHQLRIADPDDPETLQKI